MTRLRRLLDRHATALTLAVIVILWEIAGRFQLVASGALPAPSDVLIRMWEDQADYWPHVAATVRTAFLGFVGGNVIAILAAILFVRWPLTERLSRGVNIAIFALPPIAIVPVLVLALPGEWPRLTLAAIAVYFPTMTAMVVGLTEVDPRSVELVRAYGGGEGAVMRWVRLRASLPALLGGLRVAAPNAVLGAILAEFGSGSRWGLGTYLLGSLGRADPARLWGIGLAATAIAGLAYALAALAASRVTDASRAVTIAAGATPASEPIGRSGGHRVAIAIVALVLPFAIWWGLLALSGLSPIIAKTPLGVFDYLFLPPTAANAQARLLSALAETLPIMVVGMAAGLGFAFLLAVAGAVRPGIVRALMPIALVTQTMPLVALTPLLVLIFGRGVAVTVAITVSVTFFPAYVTLAQGLSMVPKAAFDLVRAYGASGWRALRMVALPASLPWLFAAARLAVPRALLGVMIAEWLATGRGLGNLLNQSRGYLDYGMIWTVALVSVLVSVILYQLAVGLERLATARR
ncbi:MAG: ABC transporter permease subunit [Bauldia litoralis]|uniref:ABC transporter permease n=2 Tax=Bauldia litoralis TaxID=665467 RepID=UPI003296C96F